MIRRASVLAAAVALAGMATTAVAADDGYENVFSSVLTAVGVLPPSASPDIDYRERPPLVLPPKQTLVTPQETGATRTAAWPADPDVIRRRKAEQEAKAPKLGHSDHAGDSISKDEQLKYRAAQAPQGPADPRACRFDNSVRCLSDVEEMKLEEERYKQTNPDKGSTLEAGVEPDRVYLTQPPKGYMKATKTIAATTEAPKIKKHDAGALSDLTEGNDTKIDPLDR